MGKRHGSSMVEQLTGRILNSDRPDVDRRTWIILTGASTAASVAILPYALDLAAGAIAKADAQLKAAGKRRPPLPVLALLSTAQSSLLFGAVSAAGLRLSSPMGLGLPHLANVLQGRPAGLTGDRVARYAASGIAATLALLTLDLTLFRKSRAAVKQSGFREPAAWKGLLATPYGAIAEEVLMRLGLQTMLAFALRKLTGESNVPPTGATMWPAIFLSNLGFGVGHLPAAVHIMPITPLNVARIVALNAVAGTVFGYLYWKESSLEASMIAHGSADIVLHVLAPLLDRD